MEEAKLKKIKKWLRIGSVVAGGITTILTPILVMYLEIKPSMEAKANEAKQGAESGYEAVIPALIEMQNILNDAQKWAESTDKEVHALVKQQKDLENRVTRCEAYIEVLGSRRNLPRPPPPDSTRTATSSTSEPDIHKDGPPVQQKAKYSIPKDLGAAKDKVKKRKGAGCEANDPLCGALD